MIPFSQATLSTWLRWSGGISEVRVIGQPPPELRPPFVIAANHVSWWDGFLLWEVQRRFFPQARHYSLMLESEWRKHRWMSGIGMLPLPVGSVSGLRRALREVSRRAAQENCLFSFFPQGRIFPSTKRPLDFRPGVRAFAQATGKALVLPVGIHLEPLNRKHPTAFLTLGQPQPPEPVLVEREIERVLDALLCELHLRGEGVLR